MEEKTEVQKTEPKKKGKGCLIAFIIFISILLLIGVGIYLGIKRIGDIDLQKDLGITYTEQDAEEILTELGTNIELEEICMNCAEKEFSNYKEVDVIATNAQASAVVNMINQELPYGSISNSQIKFNEDGTAEWSTTFTYEDNSYPVYLKGVFENDSSTSITGDLQTLSAGPIKLPANLNSIVESFLVGLANRKIEEYGIEMNDVSISKGELNIDALIPTEVK